MNDASRLLPAAILACMACGLPAMADDAEVAEAVKILAAAEKTPPKEPGEVRRARKAFATLARARHEGLAALAWRVAKDERQDDMVRGSALYALGDLPDSSTNEVRDYCVALTKDQRRMRELRMQAAVVLRNERFGDEASRAALREVLLRPVDDDFVQRTCLDCFARTADPKAIRELLLRRELYEHAYFGIRVDVCAGLAALNVRDRRALEILCNLLLDEDPKDGQMLVPQEAWLSLWTLTGRVHGVARPELFGSRPKPFDSASDMREHMRDLSAMRPGVSTEMVACVRALTQKNPWKSGKKDADGKRIAPIPNRKALRETADAYRRDIDDVVRAWKNDESR